MVRGMETPRRPEPASDGRASEPALPAEPGDRSGSALPSGAAAPATSRRPADAVGSEVPDLALPDAEGQPFSLRSRVGRGSLVLFFYIHNGTPG